MTSKLPETPAIQADLLGDWREEIAWPSSDITYTGAR
ncbi:rhamnogalacturonan lyase family protein [Arthrobacter sp. Soil762]